MRLQLGTRRITLSKVRIDASQFLLVNSAFITCSSNCSGAVTCSWFLHWKDGWRISTVMDGRQWTCSVMRGVVFLICFCVFFANPCKTSLLRSLFLCTTWLVLSFQKTSISIKSGCWWVWCLWEILQKKKKKIRPSKMVIKCHNNSWRFVLQRCKAEARTHASSNFTNLWKALKVFAADWLN